MTTENTATQEAPQTQAEPTFVITGNTRSRAEASPAPLEQAAAETPATPTTHSPAPGTVAAVAAQPAEQATALNPEVKPVAERNFWKEQGLEENDFNKKALTALKTGDFSKFAQAHSVNADTLDDNAALRWKIEQEHPTLSPKAQQRKLDDMLRSEFFEGSENDDDKEYGAELKKLAADKARAGLKESQAAYTAPVRDTAAEEHANREAADKLLQTIQSHPSTKAFETNRLLALGKGEEVYNHEVPASVDVVRLMSDGAAFQSLFTDEGGVQDIDKMLRIAVYAADMDAYDAALIGHGKALGGKEHFDELRKPRTETGSTAAPLEQFQITGRTRSRAERV